MEQEVAYQDGDPDILGEQDALEFDDEEVDELLGIIEGALERLLGNDEVLAGTEFARKTTA